MTVTHRMTGTPTYRSYRAMINRCYNEKFISFTNYGGRGVRVCDKWMTFEGFFEEMGERPEGTTIDRIDVNGNYCKENCRWATRHEQMQNKTNNRILVVSGCSMTLADAERKYGIPRKTITSRIESGETHDQAVDNDLIRGKGIRLIFNGRKVLLASLCRELGVNARKAYKRISAGWTPLRALNLTSNDECQILND